MHRAYLPPATTRVPHISPWRGRGCGFFLATILTATTTQAQWEILPTPTTADLRGIHSIGSGIAWASGTNGTVLRTTDDGKTWQTCPTPPGADKLDFRGIQAFDASTAIVMSSGKGDLSRLYKTTDACQTWTLLFTNPDKTASGMRSSLTGNSMVQFSETPSEVCSRYGYPTTLELDGGVLTQPA